MTAKKKIAGAYVLAQTCQLMGVLSSVCTMALRKIKTIKTSIPQYPTMAAPVDRTGGVEDEVNNLKAMMAATANAMYFVASLGAIHI